MVATKHEDSDMKPFRYDNHQTWSPSNMMHMTCCISTNHKSILIRSTIRLTRLQWSQVWTTVRMNPDRESLLARRQCPKKVKLLYFTSNCQFTVQIGIFVRGAVIACSQVLGFGQRFSIRVYESFQFHQLDADWLKCSSCLSHKPPASSKPDFKLSHSLF